MKKYIFYIAILPATSLIYTADPYSSEDERINSWQEQATTQTKEPQEQEAPETSFSSYARKTTTDNVSIFDYSKLAKQQTSATCGYNAVFNGRLLYRALSEETKNTSLESILTAIQQGPPIGTTKSGNWKSHIATAFPYENTKNRQTDSNYENISDKAIELLMHLGTGSEQKNFTIIPNISEFNAAQDETLPEVIASLQKGITSTHLFLIGNMHHYESSSIRGTEGHWITIIAKMINKKLELHIADSLSGNDASRMHLTHQLGDILLSSPAWLEFEKEVTHKLETALNILYINKDYQGAFNKLMHIINSAKKAHFFSYYPFTQKYLGIILQALEEIEAHSSEDKSLEFTIEQIQQQIANNPPVFYPHNQPYSPSWTSMHPTKTNAFTHASASKQKQDSTQSQLTKKETKESSGRNKPTGPKAATQSNIDSHATSDYKNTSSVGPAPRTVTAGNEEQLNKKIKLNLSLDKYHLQPKDKDAYDDLINLTKDKSEVAIESILANIKINCDKVQKVTFTVNDVKSAIKTTTCDQHNAHLPQNKKLIRTSMFGLGFLFVAGYYGYEKYKPILNEIIEKWQGY